MSEVEKLSSHHQNYGTASRKVETLKKENALLKEKLNELLKRMPTTGNK